MKNINPAQLVCDSFSRMNETMNETAEIFFEFYEELHKLHNEELKLKERKMLMLKERTLGLTYNEHKRLYGK